MIESARLHKLGFPESMPHVEFVRKFGLLGENAGGDNIEGILSNNDIDPSSYRIGPSQVRQKSFYLFANLMLILFELKIVINEDGRE